jgi:transposase
MGGPPRPPPLEPGQRETLERWARGRRTPYRLVVRSRIVLAAAEGRTNRQIARELRVSPLTVALWRSRFMLLGIDGISRDAPRLGSRRSLSDWTLRRILVTTLSQNPPEGTRWSSRSLAREVGVSHSSVLRVWRTHEVRRYRTPIAALAHDPRYRPRSVDVVGVYVSPPHRAVVLTDRVPARPLERAPLSVVAPAPPRTDLGGRTSTTEFVRLLARLESVPAARSSASVARKDFLAFLGTVADHGGKDDRRHVLVSAVDEPLRSTVTAWSARGRAIEVVPPDARAPLHEFVGRWLSEQSREPRTRIALHDLPGLRDAIDRWAARSPSEARPFAWVTVRSSGVDAT